MMVWRWNVWSLLWNASEFFGVGLGRFAPYVLGKMIGATSWERSDGE